MFGEKKPCGYTVKEIKKVFRERTNCGKYWDCKPHYNWVKQIVSIGMEEAEYLEYNLTSGIGKRFDGDDGCSESNNLELEHLKKDGELTILKTKTIY